MTMAKKSSDASKLPIYRFGNLSAPLIPAEVHKERSSNYRTYELCSTLLIQRSAELFHPDANYIIGINTQLGYRVEKNLNSAISHFHVASSLGHIEAMIQLMDHYDHLNDGWSLSKYIKWPVSCLSPGTIGCDAYNLQLKMILKARKSNCL